jgi:hypothetical protein
VVFRALAGNREASEKFRTQDLFIVAGSAEREARSATPVAGVLPNFGIQVKIRAAGTFHQPMPTRLPALRL